jgi:hypothetical protein
MFAEPKQVMTQTATACRRVGVQFEPLTVKLRFQLSPLIADWHGYFGVGLERGLWLGHPQVMYWNC